MPLTCRPIPPHLQMLFSRPLLGSSILSSQQASLRGVQALGAVTNPAGPLTNPAGGLDKADNVEDNAVELLSPSKLLLKNLTAFQSSYIGVSHALNSLLTYPNLQAMKIGVEHSGDTDSSGPGNIRDLVLNGRTDFQVFADLEVRNCLNLEAYGSWLRTVVPIIAVSEYVRFTIPPHPSLVLTKTCSIGSTGAAMMECYAQEVRDQTKLKAEVFTKVCELVSGCDNGAKKRVATAECPGRRTAIRYR